MTSLYNTSSDDVTVQDEDNVRKRQETGSNREHDIVLLVLKMKA